MKKYLLLIWIFAFQALQAQVFPVQVTPQLIPPYSLNLSDYQNAAREQVIVNLLLSDVTESNREVTLKFSMSNTAGFAIESAPVVVGALPVFLNGGIPLRLTNADLQAYFQLQNLRGISPQQYGQPLPDGVYQFCFEVFDRRSGQAISRKSCATAFLVLNDPPFLNVPSRGEAIPQKEPQNIVFQWTPRHLNATNVEYEFTLVEVWDELVDPQTAFLASRPYYQTTTRATTLLYGPGEPALLPDKNYAWRVRAVINDGISQTSVFKNNGYSEIYYFEHNAECAPPLFAISESKTATTQNIRWQQALYQGYNVQYRKKKAYAQTSTTKETKRNGKKRKKNKDSKNASYSGIKAVDGGSPWFEIKTFSEQATIFNLEKATTYEFRVGGRCRPNGGFAYGNIQEFTTASSNDQASGYQCGILPNIQISNQEPLERLGVNEVFTAGDFPVTVKFIAQGNRVSGEPGSGAPVLGANGTYSGWGFITVPYLADTRIKVIFNNIKLNSDYQLIEGVVETDYDKDWGDVDDIGDELEVLEDVGVWTIDTVSEFVEIIKDKLETLSPEKKAEVTQKIEQLEELVEEEPEKAKELVEEIKEIISEDPPPTDTDTPEVDVPESEGEGEGEPYISFRDEKYKDGDSIVIAYDTEITDFAFLLKEYPKEAVIEWQVLFLGTDYTAKYAQNEVIYDNFGINTGETKRLTIVVNYNDEKITVEFIRESEEYQLEELWAIHRETRKAKSGEKLYLVPKGLDDREKKVKYTVKLKPDFDENKLRHLEWSYIDPKLNNNLKQIFNTHEINRNITENNDLLTTNVDAGYPNSVRKSIDVEWIQEERKRIDIANKLGPLLKTFDKINYVTKKFKKFGFPCSFELLDDVGRLIGKNQLKISYEKYNEEETNNRLYKNVDKFKLIATGADIFKLKCGKDITVPIPFTSKEITLAGANLEIAAGLKGTIELNREKQIETNKISFDKSKVSGGGYVKPRIIATLIGVDGKVDVETGIRFQYPYKGNKSSVGIVFYTSDIYGYVSVSKDASVFVTNDFRYDLFKIDTSDEFEIYQLNLDDLIK